MHVKLARLGKVLKQWGCKTMEEWKFRTEIAQDVVLRLDQAQIGYTGGTLPSQAGKAQNPIGFLALV